MSIYTNGLEITAPRGPAGPDGNPIGTVLAYTGVTAPTDYLICDGSTYDIAAYSDLAKFFEVQFGSCNFFGGDGETTFAVPDMRNLFLRGYHGDSVEQLSGEIGVKQEATLHVGVGIDKSNLFWNNQTNVKLIENSDTAVIDESTIYWVSPLISPNENNLTVPNNYTSRPVNMAVNYIIKATNSEPILEEHDTDDGWHVRKWSDGYVEMTLRKTLNAFSYSPLSNGLYIASLNTGFDNTKFPIVLTEKFSETIGFAQLEETIGWVITDPIPSGGTEFTHCFEYRVIKAGGTSVNAPVTIAINVTGRWK